jgi:antibiotic biosynthesis monooxygenase (ABM) superfamily enzyme
MVICLFGATRVRPGMEEREARLHDEAYSVVESMPGFISYESYTAEDGEEVGIIRFDSRESLDTWAHDGKHLAVQAMAPEIYEYFWIQDAETYREYTWAEGIHTDGDLTGLFTERSSA